MVDFVESWEALFSLLSRLLHKYQQGIVDARELDQFYNKLDNCTIFVNGYYRVYGAVH